MTRIDPAREVLDALAELDRREALYQENGDELIQMLEEAPSLETFNNADGSLPMAAAASELVLDQLFQILEDPACNKQRVPESRGVPEDSEDWDKDVCPQCADVIEDRESDVTTVGLRYADGTFGNVFRVHTGCLGSLLSEMGNANDHVTEIHVDRIWKITRQG